MAPTKLQTAQTALRNAKRRAEQAAEKAGRSGRVEDRVAYWQARSAYSKTAARVRELEQSPEGQQAAW
jgi:hypothetical protein